jgi:hypothetical protein
MRRDAPLAAIMLSVVAKEVSVRMLIGLASALATIRLLRRQRVQRWPRREGDGLIHIRDDSQVDLQRLQSL